MTLGMEVGLRSGHIVLDGEPLLDRAPPNFRPIFIVAKRLDASRFKMPLGLEVGLS